jgi:hypothetical protein
VSTALPPLPPTAPAPSQTALPQVLTALPESVPPELAALPAGTIIDALAQAVAQGRNFLQVSTPAGTLTLKFRGDLPLPPGAQLSLQVMPGDGQFSVKLVAVNGRPVLPGGLLALPGAGGLAAAEGGLPFAPAAGGPARTPLDTPAATVQLAPAGGSPGMPPGLSAVLLRPAAAMPGLPAMPAPPPGIAADLPSGTVFLVRIAGIAPPAADPAVPAAAMPAAPSAAAPAQAAPGTPATISVAPQSAPAAAAPAAPGVPPPPIGTPSAALAPAAPSAMPTLTGTVTGHSPGGHALVQSPAGLLSLPVAMELPVGSQVVLDLLAPPQPPPAAAAKAPPIPPQSWPALADALTALAGADDQQAFQALARAVPQVQSQPHLAASLSVFASALRAGDFGRVAGDPVVKALERSGRRDLVDRLKGDFKALSAESARPLSGGEWQGYALPLVYGATIDPVHLYVRRPPEDAPSGGARKGQEHRFLVEVTLTNLGRIQFDGLIQRETKRFDLILRTSQPLPAEMRHDILGLFSASSEAVGTAGTVTFQSGGRFVDIPQPAATGATRLMV